VGVDKPAIRSAGTSEHARFFAPPARWQEFKELLPKGRRDLVIDICVASPAARTVRPRELFRQYPTCSLSGGYDMLE
jgi:hypothetical protein